MDIKELEVLLDSTYQIKFSSVINENNEAQKSVSLVTYSFNIFVSRLGQM